MHSMFEDIYDLEEEVERLVDLREKQDAKISHQVDEIMQWDYE